jgi:FG-GAP-like repeat
MDVCLVNSGTCDFLTPNPPLRNALYRNSRAGTFTDVTEKAGGGYGMDAAVGDYDGDGWPDSYVTQYGRSILCHNNGEGTFTDVLARRAKKTGMKSRQTSRHTKALPRKEGYINHDYCIL